MAPQPSCLCGYCRKCHHRAYMREYYRRPGVADQMCATSKRSRERHLDEVRARDRSRGYRVPDELKLRARRAVKYAIKTGRLIRGDCEVCGETGHAHHDDYSKPLDVRRLCPTHHGIEHRTVAV